MTEQHFGEAYGANPAENYERYFVPAIGAPMATALLERAALQPGERVLDVACGTGVVARLAAGRVGPDGAVTGVDVNPGMLAVARSVSQVNAVPQALIDWYEASAESMPLPDESYDVVLCQMGLQFMPDRLAALREMRRLLADGGRVLLNMPGPAGAPFEALAAAMESHISSEAAGFVRQVFSLYDVAEIEQLMQDAAFHDVDVQARDAMLRLPAAKDFLWQYVWSTPLGGIVARADEAARASLEDEVLSAWRPFEEAGSMSGPQRMITATAIK